ncbi:hypothetical protein Syun_012987 [Stephania yunnanensis]|uniref:Uncharacterized protein n=1 Tax=Stephania yunnanensis TaxID=152371 RepID=A0AAP0PGW7_9MAGN
MELKATNLNFGDLILNLFFMIRVVLAPLIRRRAVKNVPQNLTILYYSQRATIGVESLIPLKSEKLLPVQYLRSDEIRKIINDFRIAARNATVLHVFHLIAQYYT